MLDYMYVSVKHYDSQSLLQVQVHLSAFAQSLQ